MFTINSVGQRLLSVHMGKKIGTESNEDFVRRAVCFVFITCTVNILFSLQAVDKNSS